MQKMQTLGLLVLKNDFCAYFFVSGEIANVGTVN